MSSKATHCIAQETKIRIQTQTSSPPPDLVILVDKFAWNLAREHLAEDGVTSWRGRLGLGNFVAGHVVVVVV